VWKEMIPGEDWTPLGKTKWRKGRRTGEWPLEECDGNSTNGEEKAGIGLKPDSSYVYHGHTCQIGG
jgi:hypothetical protein